MKNYHKNKIITSNLFLALILMLLFSSCYGSLYRGSHYTYLDRPMLGDAKKELIQITGKVNYHPDSKLEVNQRRSAEIGVHHSQQIKNEYINFGVWGMTGENIINEYINYKKFGTKVTYNGGGFRLGWGHVFDLTPKSDFSIGLCSNIIYEVGTLRIINNSILNKKEQYNHFSYNLGYSSDYRRKIKNGHWGISQAMDISSFSDYKYFYLHHSVFITKGAYNFLGQFSFLPASRSTSIFSLGMGVNLNKIKL